MSFALKGWGCSPLAGSQFQHVISRSSERNIVKIICGQTVIIQRAPINESAHNPPHALEGCLGGEAAPGVFILTLLFEFVQIVCD